MSEESDQSAGMPTTAKLRETLKRIQFPEGCWIWIGSKNAKGYGTTGSWGNGEGTLAHRRVFEMFSGSKIREGATLDHLCHNKECVNPSHLEVVSRAENTRRHYALQMACKNGHAFTPENTYYRQRGGRDCRACNRERQRLRKLKGIE